MNRHQVLTGACNYGDQCYAVGSVEGIHFTVGSHESKQLSVTDQLLTNRQVVHNQLTVSHVFIMSNHYLYCFIVFHVHYTIAIF